MGRRRPKVGLALSGGAVLGFAHVGVLRVLEAHGVPVDCVAGTSAGSLVGAFLAAGLTADTMWQIGKDLTWAKIGGITLPTKGLLDSRMLQRFVEQRIGEREIGMLKLPYAATSVDLLTGEEIDWFEGRVGEAVRASCIIPGIFTPFEKAGRVLVDGGFRNFVPVDLVRTLGAEYVIAVKLMPSMDPTQLDNVFQILIRSLNLVVNELGRDVQGDVTILPDLKDLNAHDFEQAEELIKRGEAAARRVIGRIEADLGIKGSSRPGMKTFWRRSGHSGSSKA